MANNDHEGGSSFIGFLRRIFEKVYKWIKKQIKALFTFDRKVGCIEGAHALIYGWSLILLIGGFIRWTCSLIPNLKNIDDLKLLSLYLLCSVLVLFAIIQFARIYHYVHEFDLKQIKNKNHFISYMGGFSSLLEKISRGAAGFWVIYAVNKAAMEEPLFVEQIKLLNKNPAKSPLSFESLHDISTNIMIVFVILIIWDINLFFWRCLSKRYKTEIGTLKRFFMEKDNSNSLKNSLIEYRTGIKFFQRLSGILLSIAFLELVKDQSNALIVGFAYCSFGMFLILWIIEYVPMAGRKAKGFQFFKEITSWAYEIWIVIINFRYKSEVSK